LVTGGFAGIEAAKRLKKADVDGTVVDRHNHLLFQPLIYGVAALEGRDKHGVRRTPTLGSSS
jgi:NADH dehydrogenase FAD-containing subunit